jgi:hypothetical protein
MERAHLPIMCISIFSRLLKMNSAGKGFKQYALSKNLKT